MPLVYIHGNAATSESFNFIRMQLGREDSLTLDYDSADGFQRNLNGMLERLRGEDRIFFIAHSLGGIYALHLADKLAEKVIGAVTLATPYGGSKAAEVVKYVLPFNRVLRDIQPLSPPILTARLIDIRHPWTNIVTTRGDSMLMLEPNDGVVTRASMCCRNDMDLVEVPSSHFEVVLSLEAVDIIRKCIDRAEREVNAEAGCVV